MGYYTFQNKGFGRKVPWTVESLFHVLVTYLAKVLFW